MKDIDKRMETAKANGDAEKFINALRRSRKDGLTHNQLWRRGIEDVPAAYYCAKKDGAPVYIEQEQDETGRYRVRYLIGAE